MGDAHIQMLTRTLQFWDMLKYKLDDIHIQRSYFRVRTQLPTQLN